MNTISKSYEFLTPTDTSSVVDLLRYLHLPNNTILSLMKGQGIFINNQVIHSDCPVKANDLIMLVTTAQLNELNYPSTKIPLDIIYEDDYLLIVNKASGLAVHPSRANYDHSLANAIKYYYQTNNIEASYHCITRLDTDTSGLVLISKDSFVASLLYNQKIEKTYLALLQGKTEETGTIKAGIIKSNEGMKRIIDPSNEKLAITHYKRLYYNQSFDVSFVQLTLETGKTHQIRVHMSSINHPLIGDKLYNPTNTQMTRQALHVNNLTMNYPFTNKQISFSAPLNSDMLEYVIDYDKIKEYL